MKLTRRTVAIDTLNRYPDNPRFGNVPKIMESIEANGQFRPLLVQESTKQILVGNHTWEALKGLGRKKVIVDFIDCTDAEAKRIVIADNRASDLASYDEPRLAEILTDLQEDEGLAGTGFEDDDLARIVANVSGEVPKFSPDDGETPRLDLKKLVTCPECGHEFSGK